MARMIDVYFVDVNVANDVIDALANLLTIPERARADRYRFSDDRRRSIVARAATRRFVGQALGSDPASRFFAAASSNSTPATPAIWLHSRLQRKRQSASMSRGAGN